MPDTQIGRSYEIAELPQLPGVQCPCGTSRRAFLEVDDSATSVHLVYVSTDAKAHYHKRLTEIYYILECGPDARLELDGELLSVQSGTCVMIRPGTRHRAVGKMTLLNIVSPRFDPADEWFD